MDFCTIRNQKSNFFRGNVTWVGCDNESRVLKVTVPVVPSSSLVAEVHHDGSVQDEGIRVEARAALLQHSAVHLRAGVVDVAKKSCFVRPRLDNTPSFLQ